MDICTVLKNIFYSPLNNYIMSVPNLGNYISENKTYHIQITAANPDNGQITGNYLSEYSPVGRFFGDGNIGNYAWVFSKKEGKQGVAPFLISFTAFKRPDKRPYAIKDSWVGVYQEDNTILLTGSRAYVNEKGVTLSICLGTHIFAINHQR